MGVLMHVQADTLRIPYVEYNDDGFEFVLEDFTLQTGALPAK